MLLLYVSILQGNMFKRDMLSKYVYSTSVAVQKYVMWTGSLAAH